MRKDVGVYADSLYYVNLAWLMPSVERPLSLQCGLFHNMHVFVYSTDAIHFEFDLDINLCHPFCCTLKIIFLYFRCIRSENYWRGGEGIYIYILYI